MKLHVESLGAGPPLVLLHGWAMHSGLWAGVLPRLAQRHRVYCVDLPGHGHSKETLALNAAAALDALEHSLAAIDEPLAVLGWSLGGMLAQAWALRAPQRVRSLILLATTPRFLVDEDWPWALAEPTLASFARDLRQNYHHTLQRFLTLQVQGSTHGRAALVQLRHQFAARGEPSPVVLEEGLQLLRQADLRRDIPALRQPALVVSGDRDTLTPLGAGAWLARHLPDARLVRISGAAHAPQISHASEFLAAVEEFCDEHA